jgi:hypothetical protein
MIVDSVTTNAKRTFMQTRLRPVFCLFLVAAPAFKPAKIVAAEAMDSSFYRAEAPCIPSHFSRSFSIS